MTGVSVKNTNVKTTNALAFVTITNAFAAITNAFVTITNAKIIKTIVNRSERDFIASEIPTKRRLKAAGRPIDKF